MNLKSRKIISIALVFFMMLTILPLAPVTAYAEGSGDDCYIMIDGTKIDDLNNAASGSGSGGGTWTYTPGTIPTITLNNYKGDGIQLYSPTHEPGKYPTAYLRIYVYGDCTITSAGIGIGITADPEEYGEGNGVQSNLSIFLNGDNTSLTINAKYGIKNTAFSPITYIEGRAACDNCKVNINADLVGIAAYGSNVLVEGTNDEYVIYGGDVYVRNNLILDVKAENPFSNNENLAPSMLVVRNGAMVSMTSTTGMDFFGTGVYWGLYDISDEYTAYANRGKGELLIYIPAEPEFKNQDPAGNDDKTTGLTYTVGDTATFMFDSDTPNGFTAKKSAKLRGLFAGLDAGKTAENDTDSALTLTHEFKNAGLYQLTETLELYFGSQLVGKKTHSFLIEVAAKPLVTPTITQQPESVTSATGDSVTLTAKATDANRARWYVEKSDGTVTALGDAFAADGTSTQTVSKASNAVGNRYYCAFWSEDGKIAKTKLVTVCFEPNVKSQGNVTVAAGNTAFLKVTESGCGHYAAANGWYKDGVELTSGDKYYIMGTTLAVQNAAAADAGTYTYKYVTEHGDEVTANVTLTVNTGSSSTTIDTFDITGLDNPVILGTVADTSVSVPTGANYTVESVTWTAGVNGSGVVTGSSGMVSIKLKAKDGYTFKSGDLAGTVEGIYKTVSSVPANATEITVNVDYNDYSNWKIAYPENDTVSITTDSLTFKKGTAANGQKVEGTFTCTHGASLLESLHHNGMTFEVQDTTNYPMPAGLTLKNDGTIEGTPIADAGVYTVMVIARSVKDGNYTNAAGLAVKAIEIVVEAEDAVHQHNWQINNPVAVTPATCEVDGKSKITCSGCTETVEITTPATGHNWGEWPAYMIPTCQDDPITITRTCANDSKHTESKTINPIHMATDWTTDENYHWKVCGYCETKILVEKDAHKDTNSDNKCDVCEYDMTPVHEHTYATEWSKDATYHWKECSCGLKAEEAEHVYDNSKDATCDVCNYTRTVSSGSSSGGGFSGSYNYPVIVGDTDGADVAVSDEHATKGEKITITVKPDAGKQVDEVIVTDADGDEIAVTKTGDNEYTFTMPASKVTVDVATEAADYGLRIVMQINNKNILVNGKTMVNDVAPVIVADRTLVPIRVVTELLGGSAHWDNATRTVTLKIDGKTMNMTIGKEIPGFGTSAVIMNDRTYVPVRYVMEKLGADVEWINATRQIIIEK